MNMKKITTVLTLTALTAGILCPSQVFAEEKSYKVGVAMHSLLDDFWVADYDAIMEAAEEKGVEIVETVANGDANRQNEQISDLIAQGCQAIIIAAQDSSSIQTAIQECNDAGVKVVINNMPVEATDTAKPDIQILSDNEEMAYQSMKYIIEKAQADGITYDNAIMMIGNLGDQNALDRKAGYERAMEETPDVVNVVVEVPTEWDTEVALSGLQNALQAYPNADLIIMPSDILWAPAQSALEAVGRWVPIGEEGHVTCMGFDGDATGMGMMADGYNSCEAVQNAVQTGIDCIDWAVRLIDGETPEGDVLDPGIIVTQENYEEVKGDIWSIKE